ncbi:alpha-ketoglutarate-dependent dioxygenase alkB homolog 4 isoform X3 [Heterodontus francisci]|uniref:alpha-ketoglutarate-dependent dioxygenase alkB homolog 4 isoform X3 n=1 Tax=Heterodontus francisci TaxID=7792 RepID=UPI00355BA961
MQAQFSHNSCSCTDSRRLRTLGCLCARAPVFGTRVLLAGWTLERQQIAPSGSDAAAVMAAHVGSGGGCEYEGGVTIAAENTAWPSCGCKGIRSCLICERGGRPVEPLAKFQRDYGPKVNFKKHKLKVGSFSGLPCFSHLLIDRMMQHPMLRNFLPVEQCNLDYRPEQGSAIDPHFDDWWLWGKRLVSVNLLSETILSMSCDSEDFIQLHHNDMVCNAQSYDPVTGHSDSIFNFHGENTPVHCTDTCSVKRTSDTSQRRVSYKDVEVAIHLPRRSLIALCGDARYKWKHGIYRQDIKSRRICSTFRELSEEFSHGGKQEALGKELLDIALSFQGVPT